MDLAALDKLPDAHFVGGAELAKKYVPFVILAVCLLLFLTELYEYHFLTALISAGILGGAIFFTWRMRRK
jgi:hypothetical protein